MPDKTPKMLEIEERFGRELDEILREDYVVKKKSTYTLSQKFAIDATTICNWLRVYGLPIRNYSEARLPRSFVKPSKEKLEHSYIDERKSMGAVAKTYNISVSYILKLFDEYNIRTRNPREAMLPINFVRPPKEQLRHLYVAEENSTRGIAKKLNVDPTTVCNWLREHTIRTRNLSESHLPSGVKKLSEKKLKRLYLDKKMSTCDIGEKLGIHYSTISKWLREYDIPRRRNSSNVSKDAVKELLKSYVGEKKYAS